MNNHERVAINSIILYIKTGITVFISILYSRYLLDGLGIVDYGIYNLVGGVIGMMGFITATLSNSGTRFIATSLGENDLESARSVFSSVLYVTNKSAWILVIGLEIIGLILINHILEIPTDRLLAANIVYQLMIINAVYSILTAPYSGLLFSREKIVFISILEICNTLIKLVIILFIIYSKYDKLILYGILLTILSILHRTILKWYCKKVDTVAQKSTVRNKSNIDKALNMSLISFSGWNLIGAIGIIATRQGRIFLVNVFFGVAINATLGIASVVNMQLSNFSSSLLKALQPQIYKSFGKGDKDKQEFLTFVSSKMGIILISLVVIPLFLEIDYILEIWLIEIPVFTAIFIRLGLILTIIGHMSYGLTISMQAHGRIKEIQITTFVLQILNFPISYTLYKIGYPVYYTFIVAIILELIILVTRLFFAQRFIDLNVLKFLKNIIIIPAFMFITSLGLNIVFIFKMEPSLMRLLVITVLNLLIVIIFSYTIILSNSERLIIIRIKDSIKKKFSKS